MKKRFIRVAIASVLAASFVAVTSNTSVNADTFRPLPGPPEVNILPGYTTTIQPANPVDAAGATLVTVQATVETNALLDDISTVTLCMYKGDGNSLTSVVGDDGFGVFYTGPVLVPTHDATAPCGDGIPNAANSVEIVWTESATAEVGGTGGFVILNSPEAGPSPTNSHKINGSTACTSGDPEAAPSTCAYDPEAQFVTLTFKFYVSFALLAGTDWNYRVSAEIPDSVCGDILGDDSTCSSNSGFTLSADNFRDFDEVSGITVSYYGEVRSGATSSASNYGFLQDGQTSPTEVYDNFAYLTNGTSQVTLHASDFTRSGGDSLTLVTDVPVSEEVALRCFDSLSLLFEPTQYVPRTTGGTQAVVELDYVRSPTIEVETDGSITCDLTYGGGADVALATYSNTVTVGIADSRL